jgi:hypothetical protein
MEKDKCDPKRGPIREPSLPDDDRYEQPVHPHPHQCHLEENGVRVPLNVVQAANLSKDWYNNANLKKDPVYETPEVDDITTCIPVHCYNNNSLLTTFTRLQNARVPERGVLATSDTHKLKMKVRNKNATEKRVLEKLTKVNIV